MGRRWYENGHEESGCRTAVGEDMVCERCACEDGRWLQHGCNPAGPGGCVVGQNKYADGYERENCTEWVRFSMAICTLRKSFDL